MTTRAKKSSKAPAPTLRDYVEAFCDAPLTRKAVMDLSSLLAKVVGAMLQEHLPGVAVRSGIGRLAGPSAAIISMPLSPMSILAFSSASTSRG